MIGTAPVQKKGHPAKSGEGGEASNLGGGVRLPEHDYPIHRPSEIWRSTQRMACHRLRKKDREQLAYWLRDAEKHSCSTIAAITTALMKSGLDFGERIESVQGLAYDLNECLCRVLCEVGQ